MNPDKQFADALEHLAEAQYFAGEVGASPHTAVREIDAALGLLHTARQRLVSESVRQEKAMLDQLDAFDTYQQNILAAVPAADHQTGMCILAGCRDHLRSAS